MKTKFIAIIFAVAIAVGTLLSSENVPAQAQKGLIVLTAANSVSIVGVIDDQSVSEAQQKLAKLISQRANQKYPLYIVLDTPGGDVQAGLRLYEFLKAYEGIETVAIGAASMGAVLMQLNPGSRHMVETGTIMFHRMSLGLSPATMDHILSRINASKRLEETIERKIARRLGMSMDEFRARSNEEWYLDSIEALEAKVVDDVVTLRCSADLLEKKETKTVEIMPFLPPVQVVKSACPLL